MEIHDALVEAKKAEGWSDAHIAAICGVHQVTVGHWVAGTRIMRGDSFLALQRASKTFRDLTLGDSLKAA